MTCKMAAVVAILAAAPLLCAAQEPAGGTTGQLPVAQEQMAADGTQTLPAGAVVPGPAGGGAGCGCNACHPQGCFLRKLLIWATYCPKERVCSCTQCCNSCHYKGVLPIYTFFLNPPCVEGCGVHPTFPNPTCNKCCKGCGGGCGAP